MRSLFVGTWAGAAGAETGAAQHMHLQIHLMGSRLLLKCRDTRSRRFLYTNWDLFWLWVFWLEKKCRWRWWGARGREWRSSGRGRKSRVRKSSISIIIVLYCIYLLVNARTILLLLLMLWLSLSNGLPASRPCSLLRRDVKGGIPMELHIQKVYIFTRPYSKGHGECDRWVDIRCSQEDSLQRNAQQRTTCSIHPSSRRRRRSFSICTCNFVQLFYSA